MDEKYMWVWKASVIGRVWIMKWFKWWDKKILYKEIFEKWMRSTFEFWKHLLCYTIKLLFLSHATKQGKVAKILTPARPVLGHSCGKECFHRFNKVVVFCSKTVRKLYRISNPIDIMQRSYRMAKRFCPCRHTTVLQFSSSNCSPKKISFLRKRAHRHFLPSVARSSDKSRIPRLLDLFSDLAPGAR